MADNKWMFDGVGGLAAVTLTGWLWLRAKTWRARAVVGALTAAEIAVIWIWLDLPHWQAIVSAWNAVLSEVTTNKVGLLSLGALFAIIYLYRIAYRRGHTRASNAAQRQADLVAAAEARTLSEEETVIVRCLVEADGAAVSITTIQDSLGWSFLRTELVIDKLTSKRFIERVTDTLLSELAGSRGVSIRLSKAGVQYAARQKMLPPGCATLPATRPSVQPDPVSQATPRVSLDFAPNERQRRVLEHMLNTYPVDVELQAAHKAMQGDGRALTPAHTELELEGLHSAGILSVRQVSDNATYYKLTKPGRDFMLVLYDREASPDADGGAPKLGPDSARSSAGDIPRRHAVLATMSETATKIDLAHAYKDMGDPKNARSVLREVLIEGSDSQKRTAQQLLDSLER